MPKSTAVTANGKPFVHFKRFIGKTEENPKGTPVRLYREAEYPQAEVANFSFPVSMTVASAIERAEAKLEGLMQGGFITNYFLRTDDDSLPKVTSWATEDGVQFHQLSFTVNTADTSF